VLAEVDPGRPIGTSRSVQLAYHAPPDIRLQGLHPQNVECSGQYGRMVLGVPPGRVVTYLADRSGVLVFPLPLILCQFLQVERPGTAAHGARLFLGSVERLVVVDVDPLQGLWRCRSRTSWRWITSTTSANVGCRSDLSKWYRGIVHSVLVDRWRFIRN